MCEATAYLMNKNGDEELYLADVDLIEPTEDGKLRLVSIYGEQKTLAGRIKSMSLVNHRVVLAEDQDAGKIFCTEGGTMADQAAIDKVVESLHWLGHDTFRLDTSEGPIYFDPYELKDGPEAKLILVSHEHFDHCVPEDVAKIQGEDTVILTESDAAGKLTGKVKALAPGQEVTLGKIKVNTVPAYNLDKEFHPRANDWLGFIVTVDGVSIYHAGDTDYIPEMDALHVDIALLPVSGTYVMTADEAVRAAQAIGPKVAIPMHYGAIVGDENDAAKFAKALEGLIAVRILPKEGQPLPAGRRAEQGGAMGAAPGGRLAWPEKSDALKPAGPNLCRGRPCGRRSGGQTAAAFRNSPEGCCSWRPSRQRSACLIRGAWPDPARPPARSGRLAPQNLAQLAHGGRRSHGDEGVAHLHHRVGRRVEAHGPVGLFHGQHDQIQLLADARILEAHPGQGGLGPHGQLLHAQGLVGGAVEGQVDEIGHRGPQHGLGHAPRPDEVGAHHLVGPGVLKLALAARLGGPGDDEQVGAHVLGREHDVDVVRVRAHRGDEALGPLQPGGDKALVLGGRTQHIVDALGLQAAGDLFLVVDDHHLAVRLLEHLGDQGSDSAVAADDVMVLDGAYGAFQASSPHNLPELALHHELGKAGHQVKDGAHAGQAQDNGEDASFGVQGTHLAEAHRGHGDHGHVQGFQPGVVLQDTVAHGAHEDHPQAAEQSPENSPEHAFAYRPR
eukprot:TRINITY_DN55377_c0_g1_i1.p1 TRINITY_DN55377_c0_g1~~TRINITY_DN55377_c0_g1_i1.p1  ORF type:complete len:726 (+),score=231.40 TRINITY_DN55377_c0_g1_i1:2-2179(+)